MGQHINVGNARISSTIQGACDRVLAVCYAAWAFDVETVTFTFNGTPVTARRGDTVESLFRQWNETRAKQQDESERKKTDG